MNLGKSLLAVFAATALLGILVGTTPASRLNMSSPTWRTTFTRFQYSVDFVRVVCPLTMEGSFHTTTIAKTTGTLVGQVTRAAIGTCSLGSATLLAENLPWHERYASFSGTLPRIGAVVVDILGFGIRAHSPLGIECLLGTSTATEPLKLNFLRETGGALTSVEPGGEITNEVECLNIRGRWSAASSTVTVLNSASRITVSLI